MQRGQRPAYSTPRIPLLLTKGLTKIISASAEAPTLSLPVQTVDMDAQTADMQIMAQHGVGRGKGGKFSVLTSRDCICGRPISSYTHLIGQYKEA